MFDTFVEEIYKAHKETGMRPRVAYMTPDEMSDFESELQDKWFKANRDHDMIPDFARMPTVTPGCSFLGVRIQAA